MPQSASATAFSPDSAFDRFRPRDERRANRIDYSAWSEALDYIVFPMGRSLRQGAPTPEAGLGSRRIFGHVSRYRLEGNRVMFSFFTPELRQLVADYRQDLETTGTQLDIASLPRNEQLAFWFNLHNVALIEKIAAEWPVRQPRMIEVDGVPLDEAKFITVSGVAMSLRDIRQQIVYRNWRDPLVIYGFWRGDIGGPSIQSDAFNGASLRQQLERGAREFVNSLRGTQKQGDRLLVSTIYDEARPHFFADWPEGLRRHIAAYANEEVREILDRTSKVQASVAEPDIADLAGGVREPTYSLVTSDGTPVSFRIPRGTARLLSEQQRKMQQIMRDGPTGEVIFNPISLPGHEAPPAELE